jgi:hypothetical protein
LALASVAVSTGLIAMANGGEDIAGAYECALFGDYRPCTMTSLAGGAFAVNQTGPESFEGTLVEQEHSFHLDGTYKLTDGTRLHLAGDVSRVGNSIGGRVKIGTTPYTVDIRPTTASTAAEKAPATSLPQSLLGVLSRMTSREAVASTSRLPLVVRVSDAPRLSFTVKRLDERIWEKKLRGIFGMVPRENNIGVDCNDAKMRCKVTALSGAEIWFYFANTSKGAKLNAIELPSEGD